MKHKKLNTAGVGHIFLPLLIMVAIALIGSYLVVANAQTAKPAKHVSHPPKVVIHHPATTAHSTKVTPHPKTTATAQAAAAPSSTMIDISSPQCGASLKSIGRHTIGIVGLNGTKLDFATNPCVTQEAKLFTSYSLYVGTNYPSHHCPNKLKPYPCGQKAGQYDIKAAQSRHLNMHTWWLDVETGTGVPWSTPANNTEFLHGLYDTLNALPNSAVGLYSTADLWSQITGGVQFSSAGNWYATGLVNPSAGTVDSYCSKTFAGDHTAVVQYINSQNLDVDVLC